MSAPFSIAPFSIAPFSIEGIAKSFNGQPILRDVGFTARPGEFVALVGPSGCGKSTLLRIAAGLETPDAGAIRLGGADVTEAPPAARNVAMVFQSYALYPHLTAGENIAVPLMMRELSRPQRLPFVGGFMPGTSAQRREIGERVRRVARSLQIDHLLDRKPAAMSGGQRQRVALARALVRRPALFLMDEPLSNLDANLRVHARGEIVDLHREAGVPTLYVTHDQAEALSMADRVAVLQGGRLMQIAPPAEIYDDPTHLTVARFIGSPRINLLAARVEGDGTVLARDGTPLPVPMALALPAGREVTVAVRPERLRPTEGTGLPARVRRLEFLGSDVLVYCDCEASLDGEPVVAQVEPSVAAGLAPGAVLRLAADPAHFLFFDGEGARLRAPGGGRHE